MLLYRKVSQIHAKKVDKMHVVITFGKIGGAFPRFIPVMLCTIRFSKISGNFNDGKKVNASLDPVLIASVLQHLLHPAIPPGR
jgi:hypothetical protein